MRPWMRLKERGANIRESQPGERDERIQRRVTSAEMGVSMATTEEQLKQQLAAALAKLAAAKKKKRNAEWKPDYPGQHRGY
jgi:hypothetical protein